MVFSLRRNVVRPVGDSPRGLRQVGCIDGVRGGDGLTARLAVKRQVNIGLVIFRFDLGRRHPDGQRGDLGCRSNPARQIDNHTRLRFNHNGVLGVKPPTCRSITKWLELISRGIVHLRRWMLRRPVWMSLDVGTI